jgi:hypothetical protein
MSIIASSISLSAAFMAGISLFTSSWHADSWPWSALFFLWSSTRSAHKYFLVILDRRLSSF